MGERSYTVREIDDLRRACDNRYLWGRADGPQGLSGSGQYFERDKVLTVEGWVRTYMIAGITAQDLIEEDQRRLKPTTNQPDKEQHQ